MRRVDLLVELLHKMAIALDYDFDKTHIKNSSYSPVAHGDLEIEQTALRKKLLEVLDRKRTIPMFVAGMTPNKGSDRSSQTDVDRASAG